MPVIARCARAFLLVAALPVVSVFAATPSPAPPAAVALAPRIARTDSLSIRDLLDIATVGVGDLSADGRWLAVTVASRRDGLGADFSRDGDPTYLRGSVARVMVIDTKTGVQRALWPVKKTVRGLTWSPDGTRLAFLLLENDALQVNVWDRASGKFTVAKMPAGQYVAENSELRWTEDGRQLAFAARAEGWRAMAKSKFAGLTSAAVVALDGKDDFIEWDGMNRLSAQRSIVVWDIAPGTVKTLVADALVGQWTLAKDGSAVTVQEDITKKTDYDVIGGREFKLVARPATGAARTLFATLKGVQLLWSDDGQRYAFTREGKVFLGSIADTSRRQLLGAVGEARSGANVDSSSEAKTLRAKERFSAVRWSPVGDALLASNSEGLWVVNAGTGAKEMVAALPDSNSTAPRPSLAAWSPEGRYLYLTVNARTQWERSIVRYDRETKQREALVKDGRLYNGLRLSKDGSTAVLLVSDGNRVPDVYVADARLGAMKKIVEANPQLAQKPIAKTELINYMDADGKTRYGVVHYPAGYQKGTRYPTVFIVYEDFFDDGWDAHANLLAAHGYAVVKPSVGFEIGYPGEAWVKGVTAAANAVIAMGLADSSRLAVQGTSYGGYATNLLITQTNRFRAAINMSGKVDFISFYTDSPRLGVRNVHAAEKSQDRIGATMWQQPQKYIAHSAVMFADRITTPLLLMTGGEDHNVPALNTREMYYALRRLGKTVSWVNYTNGGHGVPQTTESDFMDYHQRMLDWYAKYLGAGKTASATDGGGR